MQKYGFCLSFHKHISVFCAFLCSLGDVNVQFALYFYIFGKMQYVVLDSYCFRRFVCKVYLFMFVC